MATELKYNGEWLIPLQRGYRHEYPQGAAVRPAAVTVSASFRLRDAVMISWWHSLYAAGVGGKWSVALDTVGWLSVHDCVMIDPPQLSEYTGNSAVVALRLSTRTAGPESLIPSLVITIDEYDFPVA